MIRTYTYQDFITDHQAHSVIFEIGDRVKAMPVWSIEFMAISSKVTPLLIYWGIPTGTILPMEGGVRCPR